MQTVETHFAYIHSHSATRCTETRE